MKYMKLSLGIVIILAGLAASMMASKLAIVRGSWQKKAENTRKEAIEKRKKVAELEKIVNLAKTDLQQAVHGWERYFPGIQVGPGGQPGTLDAQLGTTMGLAQGAVVYVFQPSPDGAGTIYIGPFRAVTVLEQRSALIPNWRFRPGEEAGWRFGPGWRFRTNIPQQHKTKFNDYETVLLKKDELFVDQQKHLADQQAAKKNAENQLQNRHKELNGDPDLVNAVPKGENLDRYLIEGYHKAVSEAEEKRDEVQSAVDDLRRKAKRTRDEIQRLIEENEGLVRRQNEAPLKAATTKSPAAE